MTNFIPPSDGPFDEHAGPASPVSSSTLVLTSVAALVALVGAVIISLGFAAQQDNDPVASEAVAATVTAGTAESDERPVLDPQSDADNALAAALAAQLRADGESDLGDPDCVAGAFVQNLGGATEMESRYGITVATAASAMPDLALPKQQAVNLTDGLFDCGFDEVVLSAVLDGLGTGEDATDCVRRQVNMDLVRDTAALEFMSESDRIEFEPATTEAVGVEFLSVLAECETPALGLQDDSDTDACDAPSLKVEGTLTVGTGEVMFLPWIADDNPESGAGFESALIYALADEMGIETVTWIRTRFDDALASGVKDYDFNIQQYRITPDRAEVVDFSDGYYQIQQTVIGVPGSAAASATSIADLEELRLGALFATPSLDYLAEKQPTTNTAIYDDYFGAKSAIDAGRIDGMVFDLPTAYYVTTVEIPDASILGLLPRSSEPDELGMLFEKGSLLVTCVNQSLAALRSNGTIAGLEHEWLANGGSIPTLTN